MRRLGSLRLGISQFLNLHSTELLALLFQLTVAGKGSNTIRTEMMNDGLVTGVELVEVVVQCHSENSLSKILVVYRGVAPD